MVSQSAQICEKVVHFSGVCRQGPLVYIQVFNKRTIFLNSAKVASDLLDSRSSIYSERSVNWMAHLAGRGSSIFRTSFSNPRFRNLRRLVQDGLTPRAVKSYRPLQLRENLVFMNALVDSPSDFRAHIRR
jgi:cytochrome P450